MFESFAAATLVALGALLLADSRGSRAGVWVAKPLAAAGFVAAALAAGALASDYGRWVLAALLLSWLGDVLLIPRGTSLVFRLGVASFLLAHVAYAGAFVVRGVRPALLAAALSVVVPASLVGWRWLRPHVPQRLRIAVQAYVLVISAMLVLAAGTLDGDARIVLGAVLFYASDLAVARERFVVSTFWNRAWGLPLYFGAQLVLASSVG